MFYTREKCIDCFFFPKPIYKKSGQSKTNSKTRNLAKTKRKSKKIQLHIWPRAHLVVTRPELGFIANHSL